MEYLQQTLHHCCKARAGTSPRHRLATVAVATLVAVLPVLGSCTSKPSLPDDDGRTDVSRVQGSGATKEGRDTSDALRSGGIPQEHLECAMNRVDPTEPIGEATVERVRSQCEAVEEFSSSVADNFGDLDDEQRACLTSGILSLDPTVITGLYVSAFDVDTTVMAEEGGGLESVLESCHII